MKKDIIRDQFNKQAQKFSNFSLTKNIRIFDFIYSFCDLNSSDTLIDVACGSGDFAVYCAQKMQSVYGIDISDNLLEIAVKNASFNGLNNVVFLQSDVENLPFINESVSVCTCRSAIHHFENPDIIFKEMVRCLKNEGKICIQDMISYDDSEVDSFFERLDRLIDPSHNRALSEAEITDLFHKYNLRIGNVFKVELEHSLKEYLSHALQSESQLRDIHSLIDSGLKNPNLSYFLYIKDDEIYFKRSGIVIWGIH